MNDRIQNKDSIAVIGFGYVGSSLATLLADRGFDVHGVDVDPELVEKVNDGVCPIQEDQVTERFERYADAGRISATTSFDVIGDCETVIVTVGTPLAESDPDVSAVKAATESIGRHLREGQLVIYRSTLPATLTESVLVPILETESGLEAGVDFDLAFCPERMAEGTAFEDLRSTPVVVGGLTEQSQAATEAFWEGMGLDMVSVSSPTAAEFAKLADNWWIDLNIALANEVALLSEELGVDAMEVITAANTLPKGQHNVNILYPGAGVGGSCLIKDPWFVANLGDEYGLDLQTPRTSRRVNEQMPGHMVELLEGELDGLDGARVAVLGYAFKAGTDDTRNTPAAEVVEELRESGAEVRVSDPFVPAATVESEVALTPSRLPEALDGADAVLVVTGHEQYRSLTPDTLAEHVGSSGAVLVDGRFTFEPGEFRNTPITYVGVGRGETRD